MRIVVGSAWRNSAGLQVSRYLAQVDALRRHAGPEHHVRIVAVEGDSVDLTVPDLQRGAFARQLPLELVTCNHGRRMFGSVESTERFEALSKVGNQILEHVRECDDVLVYVESDLLWDAHTIGSLIDIVSRRETDVVAPLVMAGSLFYDIWAYRKNGERFSPFPPFHAELLEKGLTDVDSVGSCLVMRSETARRCRIVDNECLVGFCADARMKGFRVSVAPEFRIHHP